MTPGESLNRMTACLLSDPIERGNAGETDGSSPEIAADSARAPMPKLRGVHTLAAVKRENIA